MALKLNEELASLEHNRGNYANVFPGYITHIRFPRFKNIADGTRIEFTFPVTALVGSNGSGKTSVLNALYGAPARKSTGTMPPSPPDSTPCVSRRGSRKSRSLSTNT